MNKTNFFNKILHNTRIDEQLILPDRKQVYLWIDDMIMFLFPSLKSAPLASNQLANDFQALQKQLQIILNNMQIQNAVTIVESFFNGVESIYDSLLLDLDMTLAFDPAASSKAEIIAAYPGFYATVIYRISHKLHTIGLPLLPRVISEYAHRQTGVDIHAGAIIGPSFVLDHGTGVVIGETAVIGKQVRIYQGVTLGAIDVKKQDKKIKRHPTVEDNVVIYSGASILGGNTVIGNNSIIGGNAWLVKSVEPYSIVYNQNKINVKQKNTDSNATHFII